MKRPRLHMPAWWRPVWPAVLILLVAFYTLIYRLISLAPSLSPTEQATVASSQHLPHVVTESAPIPLKLLEWASLHVPTLDPILQARFPSVLLGIISLIILAYILERWYGRRSMVFGLVLIASSAWFLHISRFAGLEIEYFAAIVALLAAQLTLYDHEDSAVMWFVWLVTNMILLFVPGMIWFVLASAAWQWRAIVHAVRRLAIWQTIISIIIPLGTVSWLTYDVLRNHNLLLPIVGLPTTLDAVRNLPHALLRTLELFVYNGPSRPELWLGQLPLLDGFIIASFAAGIFFYARHWRATRTQLLGGYLVLGIVLISLGGVGVSLVVPIIYLVAVAGIAYILHFWLRTFPRNPLARYFGIGIVLLVIVLSCYYNLTQYFTAWPHNPEVAQVYHPNR